ncbi:MAG: hypothetical protein LC792_04865, partial [Actinobacteria bacterium]|nr:hypothetical protein [Actinomycetota bacterium]
NVESNGFLGSETVLDAASSPTLAAFDEEVGRLLAEAESAAGAIIVGHRSALDALAAALEAEETLEGERLEQLLAPVPAAHTGLAGDGHRPQDGGTPERRPAGAKRR